VSGNRQFKREIAMLPICIFMVLAFAAVAFLLRFLIALCRERAIIYQVLQVQQETTELTAVSSSSEEARAVSHAA
jgi:hypothetical protein